MKTLDPALLFSDPAFSLGLSQEPRVEGSKDANGINDNAEEDGDEENVVANIEDVAIGCRKSKRQKVPTKFLLGEYECDRGFLKRTRKAFQMRSIRVRTLFTRLSYLFFSTRLRRHCK